MTDQHFETAAIHGGFGPDAQTGATKVPIYQSAGFAHESAQELEDVFQGKQYGYYYSRVNNPTISAIESRLNAIEKGRGTTLFSSGMAAISNAIFAVAKAGDNIVVGQSLFGSTYYLLTGHIKNCGIDVRFVDSTDVQAFDEKSDDKTRAYFVEALGNPKLDVPDLPALVKVANKHNIPLMVDSTFTTPYLLPAKELGVHVVIHATTKYIAGGGSTVGGAVVDTGVFAWKDSRSELIQEQQAFSDLAFVASLKKLRANTGACQAPFNAFLTGLGFETLQLRMDRHSENALKVAQFCQSHDGVTQVNYPGLPEHPQHALATTQFKGNFSGMVTIRVGSKDNAHRVVNAFKMIRNLVNLGDSKTLAVCPAETIYRHLTEQQRETAGVYSDLIRLSVGLENSDDIIRDLSQALDLVKRNT